MRDLIRSVLSTRIGTAAVLTGAVLAVTGGLAAPAIAGNLLDFTCICYYSRCYSHVEFFFHKMLLMRLGFDRECN